MLKRQDYEELYCPEHLDKDNPYNYIRKNPLLPLGDGLKPWYPCDSDFTQLIPSLLLIDKEVDNYSIGIYTRLCILETYKRPWSEIYNYGSKDFVDKALDKLEKTGYIKKENNTIRTVFA